MSDDLRIDGDRLLRDLADLAEFGGLPDGSAIRPALSDADLAARGWLRECIHAEGFELREDGAGNISARLSANSTSARTVMFGSHLDGLTHGGRLDGALGVAAALEVLRTVRDNGIELPVHLEAISLTDEEGTWIPLLGSRALVGALRPSDFDQARGGREVFEKRLAIAGLSTEGVLGAARDPADIAAWIEVHTAQASWPALDGDAIGVVTDIVGIATYWLDFLGRADHAALIPMDRRLDALRGVAEFIRQSRDLVINRFPEGVLNCGDVRVSPGMFNVVPERAQLALEFRHGDANRFAAMREALLSLALHVVEIEGLALEVEQVATHEPAPMHRDVIAAIEAACSLLELSSRRTSSYAGYDTQIMAAITPAGMLLVPPSEAGGDPDVEREICANAGNVLLHTVLTLARRA
jgi:N-carbamoyl-L-amino-acid hydrolase